MCSLLTTVAAFIREVANSAFTKADLSSAFCLHDVFVSCASKTNYSDLDRLRCSLTFPAVNWTET